MNSVFHRLRIIYVMLAFTAIGFAGCREHTLISSALSPAADTVGVHADTLSCITHTFYDDNIYTSVNITGLFEYQGVGALTDSFFGTMTGSTYFQIANTGGILTIDTSVSNHIDSVILNVPYSGFAFGDTNSTNITQSYQAFYLDDTIGYNSVYFPYTNKSVDIANPLSDPIAVNVYHLRDSVTVAGVKYHPAMRLKLNKAHIMSKLNNAITIGAGSTIAASAFVDAFKGICVRPADYRLFNKVIPYFILNGSDDYSKAGVLVYYHTTAYPDSVQHLAFSHEQALCGHFNNITKSYSRFPIHKLYTSTQTNDSIIALQNQPGATIDVKIYGLKSIPKDVIINKADLQISLISSLNSANLFAPAQIYPIGIGNGTYPTGTTAGDEYTVLDRYPLTTTSPYGILDGTSHTITYGTTNITTYTVGIPREVISSIAANNDTLHYHIRGTQVLYGAYRMLAAGGNYSDIRYKTKLIVVHSSLKK